MNNLKPSVYHFDAAKAVDRCAAWIRKWFSENGRYCNAVVGISGGKDSAVVAALCVKALGKDRVIGVTMPNVVQPDIQDAIDLAEHLGIRHFSMPITNQVYDAIQSMKHAGIDEPSEQTQINLPARMRMAMLYAVSQSMNGRVANTCNLSENYVGYSTRYGDDAGDFSPLGNLTCSEVVAMGHALGLPAHLVDKAPSDGLCGKTDEDNLGFTYAQLDCLIRFPQALEMSEALQDRIMELHDKNSFKLRMFEKYEPSSGELYGDGADAYEKRYENHAI